VEAAAIHGDRNQSQRQRALDAFTAGHPRVLVATDVAARGIHVDDVDLVVQFDPPNDHKDYLHRSGRTARAGATGMVIALVDRGQVRELQRLHEAAGVTAASDEVAAGHHVVRQIAASGTPVPPAPPAAAAAGRPAGTARRRETARETGNGYRESQARQGNEARGSQPRHGNEALGSQTRQGNEARGSQARRGSQAHRRPRVAAGRPEGSARGTAQSAWQSHRPQQAHGTQHAKKSA
jgi:superfamily II DNA/RNA helicase